MIDKLGVKWIEIDLDKLVSNIRTIQKRVAPAEVIGVVKADAYGHGSVEIAQAMTRCGVKKFAVSCLEEAIELRRAFVKSDILLFGSSPINQIADIINYDITPTVCSLDFAKALDATAKRRKKCLPIHVEVDTGMGRVGPACEKGVAFVRALQKMKGLKVEGLFSHFATSDETDGSFASLQKKRFDGLLLELKRAGIKIPLVHLANSGGVLNVSGTSYNAVRPGLISYGIYPCEMRKGYPKFESVFSFKARVSFVKTVPKGFAVSYGRKYVTDRATDIVTLPVGYADGFQRQFTNRGHVLIKNKRLPVVGTVCMDMLMVDAGPHSGIKAGDEAIFIGTQGRNAITVYEIARDLGTIPYEVICSLGRRLSRVYIQDKRVVSVKRMISEF